VTLRLLLALTATGCLFLSSPLAGDAAVFVPDPERADTVELRGSTWVAEGPGYVLRLQQLDNAQRLAYIQHATGLTTDPFASRPDQPARYVSFILEIENRGVEKLHFNSTQCWLVTNRNKVQSPILMSDLSFQYRQIGRDMPAAYERVQLALLDDASIVDPGRSVAGLLVYRRLGPKTKRFRVDARVTSADGAVGNLVAAYRKLKDKELASLAGDAKSTP